jgi:peptide/nickel transport system ATP-binding protein
LGCSFHPRCPEATPVCGWESRDLRVVIEEHWTRRTAEAFEQEREVIGDLEGLDRPDRVAKVGKGGPAPVRALLDRMRDEDPEEPLWGGVEGIHDDGDGVRVEFREGVDPALRRAGGVQVACVLYPESGEPDPGDPGADSSDEAAVGAAG